MTWFSWQTQKNQTYLVLQIHVQPNAKKTEIIGLHGEALKVKLHAPPVEGQANQALIKFFAAFFGIPVKQVELIRGQTSRQKTLALFGTTRSPESLLETH